MLNNKTGANNTAYGSSSLISVLSGSNNTAIGHNSQFSSLSGFRNTSTGQSTLLSNKYGDDNTAIGFSALYTLTGGASNTAIGTNASYLLKQASFNTTVGGDSLYFNVSGDNNVAVGRYAGRYYFISPTYFNNIGPTNSIYIGYDAYGGGGINQTNQIVIGYQAFGFGSNTVTLGNDSITRTVLKGAINLGGVTGSFTSLTATGTTINARLADNTEYAAVQSLYHRFGAGSPEGVVSAPVGAIYHNTTQNTPAKNNLYVKENGGTGNTGWVAK